jgi:hypothetical protein
MNHLKYYHLGIREIKTIIIECSIYDEKKIEGESSYKILIDVPFRLKHEPAKFARSIYKQLKEQMAVIPK